MVITAPNVPSPAALCPEDESPQVKTPVAIADGTNVARAASSSDGRSPPVNSRSNLEIVTEAAKSNMSFWRLLVLANVAKHDARSREQGAAATARTVKACVSGVVLAVAAAARFRGYL